MTGQPPEQDPNAAVPPAAPTPPPAEPTAPAAQPAAPQPAYAPAQPVYAPAPQAPGVPPGAPPVAYAPPPGSPGGNFKSGRGKTIGLIVAGVVAVGALGGLGAAVFGGGGGSDFSASTGGRTSSPGAEVSPSADGGGILNPSPVGSATPEPSGSAVPSPTSEPSPSDTPTDSPTGPQPTLDPVSDANVVTIGNGVQVPVLDGWTVVGQGDSDVLLGDGDNSFVYAVTGTVDPSADAASVISASLDGILPKQNYTQLRKTDIAPLEAFGSVVSIAAMQYQATWTDQQASVPLQGLLICAVRQDGTAVIMTAEHAPPEEFNDSSASWAPVVNATLGLFGSA